MPDVVDSIRRFNAGRDPERLAMKYRNLSTNPFVFLRGTCHLFYERLPDAKQFREAPLVWSCGDLHLENFGSFKGDDRLVHFDINDFDEAALAPATWDLVRMLASVIVAADTLNASRKQALGLCKTFVLAYADALAGGKARWIERETTHGLVRELLDSLKLRSRADLLDRRTERKKGRRTLKLDGKRVLPASDKQRSAVTRLIEHFAAAQDNPGFFEVLDVARRISGTGSLGVDRYVILVEGKGSPDANYLLDLKQVLASSLAPHVKVAQPAWASQAQRVVELQRRMQAIPVAFLHPLVEGGTDCVLRGLQPGQDRVVLDAKRTELAQIDDVLQQMGRIVAWDQLRSAGRQGSAIADELIAFGAAHDSWQPALHDAAQQAALQVEDDWQTYRQAYADGAFSR